MQHRHMKPSRWNIMWNHWILPIYHERIHILKETRLIAPLLRCQIDISAIISLNFNLTLLTQKRENILQPEFILIPRAPLQIIHNTPRQTSHNTHSLTYRNQDGLHIIPIITTPNRIKQNIRFQYFQHFEGFCKAEFCDRYPAGRFPGVLDVV